MTGPGTTQSLSPILGSEGLVLRRVLACQSGVPELEGFGNHRVLALQWFDGGAAGRLAVCCIPHNAEDMVVVLGILAPNVTSEPAPPGDAQSPVELRSGRSAIALHPDGRVRITGDDVRVESNGVATVRGAVVKLN